ncbi:MAG: PHP domain-containing protein [Candidatus Bathyarchaeia archaeon]
MKHDYAEVFSENVKFLIDLLGEPEEGELNYTGGRRALSRLEALRELKRLEDEGIITPPKKHGFVNVHVHTSESFSVFRSPAEAVWEAYRAGLEIFGINDHYTIAGHREFGEACKILGLRAVFSIEAIAMSEEARVRGERYNDPKNPGRIYLCGKGVIRDLEPGSPAYRLLKTMREALRKRYEKMTEKANEVLKSIDSSLNLTFDDVLRCTPRGNVTERHVAQAIAVLLRRRFPSLHDLRNFLQKLFGEVKIDLSSDEALQDLIRNELLKAGGPAYVEEPAEAFPSLENLVSMFREYGAIPTYPVLGNPITEREADLNSLFDELEGYGIFAIEVIPKRNTEDRLREILRTAEKRGFPVFNGTEHNTKSPQPLVDEFSRKPEFLRTFKRGAYLILGHQFLSKHAGVGYVDPAGNLTFKDRELGASFFSFLGRIIFPDDVLDWFRGIGEENTLKIALALYHILGDKGCCWRVKPGFRLPSDLLDAIKIVNWKGLQVKVEDPFEEKLKETVEAFFQEEI